MSTTEGRGPLAQMTSSYGALARPRAKVGWKRYAPEIAAILGLMLVLDAAAFGGHRFAGVAPHPFWIPVVVFASQYGVRAGLLAVLVSTLALYVGALPARHDGADFYAYVATLAGQPAAWFVAAGILGGMRSLSIGAATAVEERLAATSRRAADMATGLDRAVAEIGRLETRIAADTQTLAGFLAGLAAADLSDGEALVHSMSETLRDSTGAAAYVFYLLTDTGLQPVDAIDEDKLAPKFRGPIAVTDPLIDRLSSTHGAIALAERAMYAGFPVGAVLLAPVRSERTGRLHGAILIERLRNVYGSGAEAGEQLASDRAARVGRAFGVLMDAARPAHAVPGTVMLRLVNDVV